MTKYFTSFFESWWKPILFWIISTLLLLFSGVFKSPFIENVFSGLFCLSLLALLISVFSNSLDENGLKALSVYFC